MKSHYQYFLVFLNVYIWDKELWALEITTLKNYNFN